MTRKSPSGACLRLPSRCTLLARHGAPSGLSLAAQPSVGLQTSSARGLPSSQRPSVLEGVVAALFYLNTVVVGAGGIVFAVARKPRALALLAEVRFGVVQTVVRREVLCFGELRGAPRWDTHIECADDKETQRDGRRKETAP